MNRAELRLAGAVLDDASAWHFAADLRHDAKLRGERLYTFLHQWQEHGWLETRVVFDGESPRRAYRITDAAAIERAVKASAG
jgi:hypothetical protein